VNVKELILRLQDFPNDMPVWTDGGGDPYCMGEVKTVEIVTVPEGHHLMGHPETHPRQWVEVRI